MLALQRETGCCPVCDRQVPRLVQAVDGVVREAYACPFDGTIGYGGLPVSLGTWADRIAQSSSV